MIKMLGIIMILGSTTALGFFEKQKLITRKKALLKIIDMLDKMTRELKFSYIEIPDLLNKLCDKSPVGNIFKELCKLIKNDDNLSIEHKWIKCFKDYAPLVGFNSEDIEILQNISTILGKYDVKEQVKSLEYYKSQLSSNLSQAEYKLKNEGNINRTLCVSIGLVIIIILI